MYILYDIYTYTADRFDLLEVNGAPKNRTKGDPRSSLSGATKAVLRLFIYSAADASPSSSFFEIKKGGLHSCWLRYT